MFANLRAALQYRFDTLFSQGTLGKFLILGAFTALVMLLGMTAALVGLFGPENAAVPGVTRDLDAGPLDALLWSFHHILDPSFFFESYGATWPVVAVSLAVSLGGLVVFGALVGFITSTLDERLEVLRRGDSAVQERDHLLMLGWNRQAPDIIRLLAERRRRPCIVVLAHAETEQMQEELRMSGPAAGKARIVLRTGAPDHQKELERVACQTATGIIILPADDQAPAAADAAVVRCLLVLEGMTWGSPRPRIVAEVGHTRHLAAARLAGGSTIPVIATGEVVALLLFQCSRQRGLSHVFDQIVAPRGAGILVRPAPACAGLRLGDLAYAYPTAVLMGISRREVAPDGRPRFVHLLNPPRSQILGADEWLILLTSTEEMPQGLDALRFRSSVALHHTLQPSGSEPTPADESSYFSTVTTGTPLPPPLTWRVLILGWNEHLAPLLLEYDRCQGAPAELVVVSGHDPTEAVDLLAKDGVHLKRLQPRFRRMDSLLPGVLSDLAPEDYDAVVVLADASWADQDPDARTLMSLVMVRDHLRTTGRSIGPRISAEVINQATGEAAARLGIDDLVVGPHLISQALVQIAEQSMVAAIYDDLLSSGGMDLYLKPASRYVHLDTDCTFRDVIYAAQHLDEVALGVWLVGDRPGMAAGLHLAFDKHIRLTLHPDDQIVVLAEELYDVPPQTARLQRS